MKRTLIIGLVLTVLFFLFARCANNVRLNGLSFISGQQTAPPPSLPKNVVKRVVIDTAKRRLILQVPPESRALSGTNSVNQKILFLPPHAVIDLTKDGTFSIIAKPYGFNFSPFLGVGYADRPRFMAGCYLLYYQYFDFGLFASTGHARDAMDNRIGLAIGYNIWRNVSTGLGYDSKGKMSLFLTVKL